MKIRCSKTKLSEIVNIVQKAISPKSTIPVLECIKIDASPDGKVVFTGNNLDLCIEYTSEIQVFEGGSIALASKMFSEIVRKIPDGEIDITVNEENNITKIKCGISEFNIQGVVTGEFPEPPVLEEKYKFRLKEEDLKKIIKKTLPFVAMNEGKRPVLTGVLFEIKDGDLHVVASDGHRLAAVKQKLEEELPNSKIVIPGSTLRELFKILKDGEDMTEIIVADRYVMFSFKDYKVFSRLVEGEFIKYEAIVNAVNTIHVRVETEVVKESLERALLLINDEATKEKIPVRLNLGFDKMEVSCMSSKGKVNDIINVQMEGDALTIGFNCRFLLDALGSCEDEYVKMEFSTATSGCFIRSLHPENDYVFMVLPVRLYN